MIRIALKQRAQKIWQKLSHLDARPDHRGWLLYRHLCQFPAPESIPILVATVVAWLLKRNVITALAGVTTAILYIPLSAFDLAG